MRAGYIKRDDMAIMLKQLAGSSLSEDDLQDIISLVLAQAGGSSEAGLDVDAYCKALAGSDLSHMVVEVPIDI